MKQKHIDAKAMADSFPTPDPAFVTDTMARLRETAAGEEIPMKRKTFTTVLITVLLLIVLAATSLAAYTLLRSEQSEAVTQARQALAADYGLTSETMGLFAFTAEQDGATWTVTFRGEGMYPPLLGNYTVVLTPGKAPQTSWTHDDVDPAVWQNGSLDAPVWGQPQMLTALQNPDMAAEIQAKMDWSSLNDAPRETPPPPDHPMEDDETYYNGEYFLRTEPGPDDLPQTEAEAMARQALLEDTTLSAEALERAVITTTFLETREGHAQWHIQYYLIDNGIEQVCGVVIEAKTGEIVLTSVTTGGNG